MEIITAAQETILVPFYTMHTHEITAILAEMVWAYHYIIYF